VVGADLVAEPARPAVNHHADLPGCQAERLRGSGIEDLRDDLHLEEMVTRAQAADLVQGRSMARWLTRPGSAPARVP
jgi:hypothetical protein